MRRKRFIGRHLMMKGEYAEDLLTGRKTSTIRLGIVVPRYNEVIVHSGGKPVAVVEIREVTHKRIGELTPEEVRSDGFNSIEELIKALRRHYPSEHIDPDTIVTLIKFEVKQKLDNIGESETGDLNPALIARLALRYISKTLDDDEKRILLDLTRTNSIRRTAYNLYGDPLKRSMVRKVLRESFQKLKSKGII